MIIAARCVVDMCDFFFFGGVTVFVSCRTRAIWRSKLVRGCLSLPDRQKIGQAFFSSLKRLVVIVSDLNVTGGLAM